MDLQTTEWGPGEIIRALLPGSLRSLYIIMICIKFWSSGYGDVFLMYLSLFRYYFLFQTGKMFTERERETDTRKNGQTTDNRWTKNYRHKSHKTFIKQLDMSSCNMKIAIIVEKIITRVNGQCITCNSAIIVIFIHCLYLHLWNIFFQLRWLTVYFYFQTRR